MQAKIAIIVDGGIVVSVASSSPDVAVDVVYEDDDCLEDDDPHAQHGRDVRQRIDDGEYPHELLATTAPGDPGVLVAHYAKPAENRLAH